MVRGSARGASTVVGVLLLVGVVVVVGGVVALGALTFLDGTGAPQATATFDYEQTPAGLRMTPGAISTTVSVRLNGRDVARFGPESAGQSVLLPTAPGDRITVVSRDGEQSVLVDRTVEDRSEIGDFIAYYRFDGDNGDTTLVDRSGNDNDGSLEGGTGWNDGSLQFDGTDDSVAVPDLEAPEEGVTEYTIAIRYRQDGGGDAQELVEHIDGDDNWLMTLWDADGDTHRVRFLANKGGGGGCSAGNCIQTEDTISEGEQHVVVGTLDEDELALYVDGRKIGTDDSPGNISMGDLRIGRDSETPGQYFSGEIYEIRLYYTAFDGEEVEVLTGAME
ncbi:LamG-like jellyroll fold domain-containing protein [Haloarcula salinisoli]|uniref:LamG domain-containing protein n=1 Tax=Haloarcula salinisoli TaxID=2487746 RepID=A0A8J7YE19_9EURY|nr:LamG-like jellyroll fold domain-containing protein [Halomicroarcula salinisoli]MBX0303757.1 LamG domain-containing protein [Halomicroarcula salinisoli]